MRAAITFLIVCRFDLRLKFLEMPAIPDLKSLPAGWVCFYRHDESVGRRPFYLDSPEDGLPRMAGVDLRTKGIGN